MITIYRPIKKRECFSEAYRDAVGRVVPPLKLYPEGSQLSFTVMTVMVVAVVVTIIPSSVWRWVEGVGVRKAALKRIGCKFS